MQLAQRRVHRAMWFILGIVIPVLFILALAMRPEVPIEADAVERLAPHVGAAEGGA